MQYAKLGKSTMDVSRICLGTMHFGGPTSEEDAFKIMDRSLEMGINFFDTANVYGGSGGRGKSEEIIGNWLSQRPGARDQIVLATKVYNQMVNDPGPNQTRGISAYRVRQDVQASLRRLKTDHIDLYQVHHIDRQVTGEEFWGTFERLVATGDVLYMGSSNFPGWGLAKYQMQAMQRGFMGLISEQTQYNLLNRAPELEVLPAALEFGIGVIPYMPLAGGLLTGKKAAVEGSRTYNVEREYGMSVGDTNQQLSEFSTLCRELGESEVAVAIAWTLAHPAVTSAIVGIRTLSHLDAMERAAELKLDETTMQKLNTLFDINRGRPLKNLPAPEAYSW